MNPLNLPATLPLARYRFVFQLQDDLLLPPYAGSTLRGVFGHSLRKIACMTKQPECAHCPLLHTCPYTRIFANAVQTQLNASQKQTPPQAYIIEPPREKRFYHQGEAYAFDMVLMGHIVEYLSLIAFAFDQAFYHGIGSRQSRGALSNIQIEHNGKWQNIFENQKIIEHNYLFRLPENYLSNIHIHFETPLRIQQQGKILGTNNISATAIAKQLLRRFSVIMQLYLAPVHLDIHKLMAYSEHIQGIAQNLWWHDWQRYSNRQKQSMKLGGVMGEWQFTDLPPEMAQLFYLGQWLHIGKETVFGLGKYRIKP